MKNAAFSPTAIIVIIACAVFLFALSILLPAFDNRPVATGPSHAPSSFSTSALGHAGWYTVLAKMGRPVARGLDNILAQVGEGGALIVAEPVMRQMDKEDILRFQNAPRALLVLPKWQGQPGEFKQEWIDRAVMRPIAAAQEVVSLASTQTQVTRNTRWPLEFTVNELGVAPTGTDRVQLMRSEDMRPIVATKNGILVGELMDGPRRVWVLSDPDIISNHGLGKGRNALFAMVLTDTLRLTGGGGGSIVFDEAVHGFRAPQWSPVKLLFDVPHVAVTIAALAAALIMLWAGCGRFGAARAAAPPIAFGKEGLIANGARLLEYAGHQGVTLHSYIKMLLYSTAMALHAPSSLNDKALFAWLDRLGRARRVTESCEAIMREVSEINEGAGGNPRLYKCARRMYMWKGEILNGSGTGRINSH